MSRILRSTPANEDLIVLWEYVAQDNPTAASALLRRIDRAFHLLAENPLLGEPQPQFGFDLRRFVVGNYLIFYQPLADGIQVVRVFHGAQQYENLL